MLAWGVLAGVVCGAAAGFTAGVLTTWLGFETPGGSIELSPAWGWTVIGTVLGVASGVILSLVPAAVAAAVVTAVLTVRHPGPTSEDEVKRDLTVVFALIVGALDIAALVAVAVGGHLLHYAEYLSILIPANLAVVPVAWRARAAVARRWSAGAGG